MIRLSSKTIERLYSIRCQNSGNKNCHFFDKGWKKFFQSRTGAGFQVGEDIYFITSEVTPSGDRVYTIRKMDYKGEIDTIGEVGCYSSYNQAKRCLQKLILSINN
jgi:hypothetical protein